MQSDSDCTAPLDLVGHSVASVEVVLQAMAGRTDSRPTDRPTDCPRPPPSVLPSDGKVARMERTMALTEFTLRTAWSHSLTPIRSPPSCWRTIMKTSHVHLLLRFRKRVLVPYVSESALKSYGCGNTQPLQTPFETYKIDVLLVWRKSLG